MVTAEVRPKAALLKRDTVGNVDDKRESDSYKAWLSDFHAHQDRVTYEVVLNMSRRFVRAQWSGRRMCLSIELMSMRDRLLPVDHHT